MRVNRMGRTAKEADSRGRLAGGGTSMWREVFLGGAYLPWKWTLGRKSLGRGSTGSGKQKQLQRLGA